MTQQEIKNEIESVTQIIMSQAAEREKRFLASLPAAIKQCKQWEHDTAVIQLNEEIY